MSLTNFTLIIIVIVDFCLAEENVLSFLLSEDPDKNRNTEQFITSRGWIDEFHSVVTTDGYFIGLHRIVNPYRRATRGPVMFLGTVGGYGKTWLRNSAGGYVDESTDTVGPNIGFEAAKRGFDVWLLEHRGTLLYSYNHTYLNADQDLEYWDFSLDEIALFDFPAAFDHIRAVTRSPKVGFVGLAFATTSYLFLASKVPRFNQQIQPVILLGPSFGQLNSDIPMSQRMAFSVLIPFMKAKRGADRPQRLVESIQYGICNLRAMQIFVCNPLIYVLSQVSFPHGSGTVNYERLSVLLTAVANNLSSWLQAQEYTFLFTNRLTMFDINPTTNILRYGRETAPEYFPERITNPNMHFIIGSQDGTFDAADLAILEARLGTRVVSDERIPIPWSALSFQDGSPADIIRYVNTPVLRILIAYL